MTESDLLTPSEVARLFGVNPKTVTRWAEAGKLHPVWTMGGHRRYRASEVYALLEGNSPAGRGDWTRTHSDAADSSEGLVGGRTPPSPRNSP